MTRDDIIRMAREAGSIDSDKVIETVYAAFAAADRADLLSGDVEPLCWGQPTTAGLYISNEKDTVYTMPLFTADQMAEAYRCGYEAGAVAEREACAKLCDSHVRYPSRLHFSAAIRARGDK